MRYKIHYPVCKNKVTITTRGAVKGGRPTPWWRYRVVVILYYGVKTEIYIMCTNTGWFCLNSKRPGGGGRIPPPLDVLRKISVTYKAVDTLFYDFFFSSLAQLLRPNSRCPGTRFLSYATFCTCSSDRKLLKTWFRVQIQYECIYS